MKDTFARVVGLIACVGVGVILYLLTTILVELATLAWQFQFHTHPLTPTFG